MAARTKIAFDGHTWTVPSQSGNGSHRVLLTATTAACTCDDFQLRQQPCKHCLAVRFVLEREGGGPAPALDTDVVPKKPSYQQDWPAYHLAQTTEKHRFRILLSELCGGVPQPAQTRCGRRPHRVGDALFAMTFKVYSTVSARRFHCDLQDAHAQGYTTNPVPGIKVAAFLENPAYTPLLQGLVVHSSLPLKSIETTFAPDSSGFSTSRFLRWLDLKHNCYRSTHDWVKVHLMVGTTTGIITAAEIHERDANDSPIMPSLLETTAQNFTVKEVPADKGYSSVENIEAVSALGATPYIAFKSSATGGSGGLWEKCYHYFCLRREEFLAHYHQRSNVESVFSSIKRKLGDSLRSRTDVAMKNEAYCKLLAHNVCRLIHAQCELGVASLFWGKGPDAMRDPS
jgi:transposase